jgi:hypothetical protein
MAIYVWRLVAIAACLAAPMRAGAQTFTSADVLAGVIRVNGTPTQVTVTFTHVHDSVYRIDVRGTRSVDTLSTMLTLTCAAGRVVTQVPGANSMAEADGADMGKDGTFLVGFGYTSDFGNEGQQPEPREFGPEVEQSDYINLEKAPVMSGCNKDSKPTGKFMDLPPNYRLPS